MNVLLVFAPVHTKCDGMGMSSMPSMALYYLGTILKNCGHEVSLVDPYYFKQRQFFADEDTAGSIIWELLNSKSFDAVGLSSTTGNWATSKEIIHLIRKYDKSIPIIVGGVHPSYFDEHILNSTEVNFVVRGEGETVLPKLLESLNSYEALKQIPGITYRDANGYIVRNENGPLISACKLETYPTPCYELIPEKVYVALPIESSRGCRFNCIFCSVVHRKNWRGFSQEIVVERVRKIAPYVYDKTQYKTVFFVDDCFSADPLRAVNILKRLNDEDLDLKYIIECRVTDILSPGFLDQLPSHLIASMQIGVEAGYDEGLKKIRKGITIEQLSSCIKLLYDKGLNKKAFLSFIIGFPWENEDCILKTVNTAAHLSSQFGIASSIPWLSLCPSDLWKCKNEYGINMAEDVFDDYFWLINKDVFFGAHPNVTQGVFEKIEKAISTYVKQGIPLYHFNPSTVWDK